LVLAAAADRFHGVDGAVPRWRHPPTQFRGAVASWRGGAAGLVHCGGVQEQGQRGQPRLRRFGGGEEEEGMGGWIGPS